MVADVQYEKEHKFIAKPIESKAQSRNRLYYVGLDNYYTINTVEAIDKWKELNTVEWTHKAKSIIHEKHLKNIFINDRLSIEIPIGNNDLEKILIDSKYILDYEDDWDDEGSVGYTIESWKSGALFLIDFHQWLANLFTGELYLPKMHHGPNGTIDIVWRYDKFRLFINIDHNHNKGTFYSDTTNSQFSSGEFPLENIKFQLLPLPLKNK